MKFIYRYIFILLCTSYAYAMEQDKEQKSRVPSLFTLCQRQAITVLSQGRLSLRQLRELLVLYKDLPANILTPIISSLANNNILQQNHGEIPLLLALAEYCAYQSNNTCLEKNAQEIKEERKKGEVHKGVSRDHLLRRLNQAMELPDTCPYAALFITLISKALYAVQVQDRAFEQPLVTACLYDYKTVVDYLIAHHTRFLDFTHAVIQLMERNEEKACILINLLKDRKKKLQTQSPFCFDSNSLFIHAFTHRYTKVLHLLEADIDFKELPLGFVQTNYLFLNRWAEDCILRGDISLCSQLIERIKAKCDINRVLLQVPESGFAHSTLLSAALTKEYVKLAALLLSQGANPNNALHGIPLLYQTCLQNNILLTQLLLEYGANVNARYQPEQENEDTGNTALHIAAQQGNVDCVRLLIEHGAHITIKNEADVTPLHKACFYGHSEIVQELLQRGAEVNAQDIEESTPLHTACKRADLELVKLLLKHKAEVNSKTALGHTPLHSVLYELLADDSKKDLQKQVIELLLAHGAQIDVMNNDDDTPLDLAQDYEDPEILALFKDKGKKE